MLVVLNQIVLEKFDPNSSETAFSTVFRGNFRPKVANDVLSGAAVGDIDLGVHVKFGNSRSNDSSDMRPYHFLTDDDGGSNNDRRSSWP